jgi:hypothetical protein
MVSATGQETIVSEPMDFNEARRKRSMSERRFTLGPYTFKRRPTIPPETLSKYATAGQDGDDTNTVRHFEEALLELVERKAVITETGQEISTEEAWQYMRFQGDENDVVSFEDLAAITQWLVSGVVERPTGQPSDSPDGSVIPGTGTTSTPTSPSEAPTLTILTAEGLSTPSTPPS